MKVATEEEYSRLLNELKEILEYKKRLLNILENEEKKEEYETKKDVEKIDTGITEEEFEEIFKEVLPDKWGEVGDNLFEFKSKTEEKSEKEKEIIKNFNDWRKEQNSKIKFEEKVDDEVEDFKNKIKDLSLDDEEDILDRIDEVIRAHNAKLDLEEDEE